MTSQQLPDHPNLEQLKKQAKSLLQGARANDRAQLERFRILPQLAARSVVELQAMGVALHDAQSVIAREFGFKSWKELRDHVEERSLTFTAAVDEFVRCATGGAAARAFRLLALHPAIAHANLYTELVLGDAAGVDARLTKQPELSNQKGGVQEWEPLLYVCHTYLHHDRPERAAGLVAIARSLLARGANPNAEYHFQWHRELPRTALWAALCAAGHLPLAEVLLQSGANSTDGVSMHITAGTGNLAALDLLHRFGVNVNGIPGGVPPLRYTMAWSGGSISSAPGVRWLLDHNVDVNLSWGEADESPLHIAALRWDVEMVELLVQHGADIHRRRADGRTAHTVAELQGNREVADWLLQHGAKDELSPLERFIAACTQGERTRAESILRDEPGLRGQLRAEHHLLMQVPAERGNAAVLETMLVCGFDPNIKDGEGITALHRAAMSGQTEAVRVLLVHGACVKALDGFVQGTPLVWAAHGLHEGPGTKTDDPNVDYPAVARQLIAAGSPLEWVAPENAPDPEATQEELADLIRTAHGQPAPR